MMRSYLLVPADSERKLAKALTSGADALILDLTDSVAPRDKGKARKLATDFLRRHVGLMRPRLFVRINALANPLSEGDLDYVMTGAPAGIVLSAAAGKDDVVLLGARIAVREALHGLPDGGTRILAIAGDRPDSLLALGSYAGDVARLCGLVWCGDRSAAGIGRQRESDEDDDWGNPAALARNLCLFAAGAAHVDAIDRPYQDFADSEGLAAEAAKAADAGFAGKIAIHPSQVAAINAAFTPDPDAVAMAEALIAAFREAGNPGALAIEGHACDQSDLRRAERLVARAAQITQIRKIVSPSPSDPSGE
ncbi:HpcH/HpaI aldolase/citrate lyase family protein [Afifella sp. YEN Y35]|uniref:HpcH/HpaI aldolase/citrate lyase family protein n=1 Tax=Afifella sp. YEN Y35 TaxID=3388337 RepID=UPI0039DFF88D